MIVSALLFVGFYMPLLTAIGGLLLYIDSIDPNALENAWKWIETSGVDSFWWVYNKCVELYNWAKPYVELAFNELKKLGILPFV